MDKWTKIPGEQTLRKTVEALKRNGINVEVVNTGEEAKQKVLAMLPEGAEVMNFTSVTLDAIGVSKEIVESGKYNAVRNKLNVMDKSRYLSQMRKLGSAPDWGVGSVHAITEEGELVIASFTGSQLAGHVFGATNIIWVVGAQKIVKNLDAALERINTYVLPLESDRANKAYGVSTGSAVNKILIIKKEADPKRATLFIVREKLGF